nr:reverse transcriptase domain-containing protein [Tanacetum cinerariifolium]
MAEKFNHEKEKNEKLKELKARLNFEGCSGISRYSESKTMSSKEHDKRHRSRRSRSQRTSVFSRIRRERSRSPIRRERSRSPRQMAKEGGVFKRLGSKGKTVSARSDSYNSHSYSRYTEALSESEDSGGNAKVWFDDLPLEPIDSYDDLKKAFLKNYLQQNKYIKDLIELHNIKQRDGESTKDFIRRYKLESRDVKGAPECMRISGFGRSGSFKSQKKKRHSHHGNSMRAAKSKTSKKEVSGTNIDKGKFKAPPPMTTSVEKRNHAKFYEFHGEVRHNPDECMHLRKQIEEMLKAGKLSHLIKEIKQNNGREQPKVTKKGETSGKDKTLVILMVQLWERVARQRITQSFSPNPEIFFPPLVEDEGTEGSMITEAIQEEVGKLVGAEIMRELHYHDWLSNPAMVKKHDGSWRMCVDFKDLNKACPKDGYSLPEIDWKVESLCEFLFKCFLDACKV